MFSALGVPQAPTADFEQLVGIPFESMKTIAVGWTQHGGDLLEGRAFVERQAVARRADVRLVAKDDDEVSDLSLSAFDSISGAWNAFHPIVVRLLESNQEAQRIALGVEFVAEGKSHDEVYAHLAHQLPKLALEGTSDLRFQINRPRASTSVDDLKVNRLASWVGVRQSIGVLDVSGLSMEPDGESRWFALLATDVNSPADRAEAISASDVRLLVDEFWVLSQELASNGDVT